MHGSKERVHPPGSAPSLWRGCFGGPFGLMASIYLQVPHAEKTLQEGPVQVDPSPQERPPVSRSIQPREFTTLRPTPDSRSWRRSRPWSRCNPAAAFNEDRAHMQLVTPSKVVTWTRKGKLLLAGSLTSRARRPKG